MKTELRFTDTNAASDSIMMFPLDEVGVGQVVINT